MQHIDLRDYQPLPSQKKFHDSKAKYRCFFGGFGSGKTKALCYEALMLGLEEPGNRILIARKTFPELEATTKMEFMNIVPPELIKTFQDTKNVLTLVNGTQYFFRALDKLDKIKSMNLGAVAIDEASEIDEAMFHMLQSRIRYSGVKRRCIIMSTNPDGHNWLWRVFINKDVTPVNVDSSDMKGIDLKPELFDHVESMTTENHHLPSDYVETLKASFSDAWIRRYIYCSFDEFSGLIFYAFEPSKCLTKDVRIQTDTNRFLIGIDPGIDTTAVIFAQYDPVTKGMLLFDEIYRDHVSLPELANMIKARLAHYRITKCQFFIDPSSVREEQTSQSSVFKDLRSLGIPCKGAVNDVNLGIMRTNKMFKAGQLKISAYLKNIIAEITEYYIDEKTGKPKGGQKDHLLDVMRYVVNSLSSSECDLSVSREQEIAQLRQRRENLPLYSREYNGVKKLRRHLT